MGEGQRGRRCRSAPADGVVLMRRILNGDHLQFEIDHKDTPLKERPDWPYPSFDARDWAEAFCKLNPSMDEGVMIAWFANALMRGYDHAKATGDTD
jgi:hypothetical protein